MSIKPTAPYCRLLGVLDECEGARFGRQTVTGTVSWLTITERYTLVTIVHDGI
jgi:hypothetical protein